MKCKLRRNVMQRDWYDGFYQFYMQYGKRPECVDMNYKTYYMLREYVRRHYTWMCNLTITYDGNYFADIEFNGVKIYLSNNLEDEVMRFM